MKCLVRVGVSLILVIVMTTIGFLSTTAEAKIYDSQKSQASSNGPGHELLNSISASLLGSGVRGLFNGSGTVTTRGYTRLDLGQLMDQCTNQEDSDGDGLPDEVEKILGTKPDKKDSDGDKLDDRFELTNGLDPLNSDSNDDGLGDYAEIALYDNEEDESDVDPLLDTDGDGILNINDRDNDNDGVPDGLDLSAFSYGGVQDSYTITIQTGGNPAYADFQIQPKDLDNLYKNMQSYDWPYDEDGNVQDTNYSRQDMTIKPVLQIETDNPPGDMDCIKYGIMKEKVSTNSANSYLYIPLSPIEDAGKKVALEGRVFIPGNEQKQTVLKGKLLWSMEVENDRGNFEFHLENTPPFPGKQEWVEAGVDTWDIDGNGRADVIVTGIVNTQSSHTFYYTIGYDMDINGKVKGWSSLKKCPVNFPETSAGGGAALYDLDGDDRPEIVFASVENLEGADQFIYTVGWGLDEYGNVAADANGNAKWSQMMQGPQVGYNNAGAGVTVTQLNGNSDPEFVFMTIDDPEGANQFRYYIGWDITQGKLDGGTVSWSGAVVSNPLGWTNAGGDIEAAQLDSNAKPDLILAAIDEATGANAVWYTIAWNVNSSGQPERWSSLNTVPWNLGDNSAGGGLAIADFDDDGNTDDILFLNVDNPLERWNDFWYRVGKDFNGSNATGGWSAIQTIISVQDLPPHNIEGLDSRIADLDRNGTSDLIILWASWEDPQEQFRYIIGWDIGKNAQPRCWSEVKSFQDISRHRVAGELRGLGFDLYDINKNGKPDMFVGWVGAKSVGMEYLIRYDMDTDGNITGGSASDCIFSGYRDGKWGFTGTGENGAATTMGISIRLAQIRGAGDKVDIILAAKALTWDGYAGTQAVHTVISVMPDLPVSGVFPSLEDGTLLWTNQDLYSVDEARGITYPQYKEEYEDWNTFDKYHNVAQHQLGVGLDLADLDGDGKLDAMLSETGSVNANSMRNIVVYNINSPANVVLKGLNIDSVNSLSDDEIEAGGTPKMGLGAGFCDYSNDGNLDAIALMAERQGNDVVLNLYTAPNLQTSRVNVLQEAEPFRLTGFAVEENGGGQAGVVWVHPCRVQRGEYEDAMLNYEAIKQKYLDEWTHEGTDTDITISEAVDYIFSGGYRSEYFDLDTQYLSFSHGDEVTPWINGVLADLADDDYYSEREHWPFIAAITNHSRSLNMDVIGTWQITSSSLQFDLTANDFAQTRLLQMKSFDFKNNRALEPWQIVGLVSTDLGAGLDDQKKVQLSTLLWQWNTGEYEVTKIGPKLIFPQRYTVSSVLTEISAGAAASLAVFLKNSAIVALDAKVTLAIWAWVRNMETGYKFLAGATGDSYISILKSYKFVCNCFLNEVPRVTSYTPSQVRSILGTNHYRGVYLGKASTNGSFSRGSLLERGNTLSKMMKWAGRAAFAVQVGFAIYAGVQVGLQFDEPAYGAYAGSVFAILQIAWAAFMMAVPYAINLIKLGFSTTGIGIAVTLLLTVSDIITFLVCGKAWSQMVIEKIFNALVGMGVDVDVNIKNLSEDISYDKMQKGLFVAGSSVRNISTWQSVVQDIKEHHRDSQSGIGASYLVPYVYYPASAYYTAANKAYNSDHWVSFSDMDNLRNQIDVASYGYNERWSSQGGMLNETTDYKYDNSLTFNTIKANLPVKILRQFEYNVTKWKRYGAIYRDDGAIHEVNSTETTLYFDVMPQGLTQFRNDFDILTAYAGSAQTETHQQSQARMAVTKTQVVALDPDGDGLMTWGTQEKTADGTIVNTDPNKWDTDSDGAGDDMEVAMGLNPRNADTDGDGINDRDELINGTEARLIDDNGDGDYADEGDYYGPDSDGDGLTDKQEIDGWDIVFTYNSQAITAHVCSDPNTKDTDGDGRTDKEEYDTRSSGNPTNPGALYTPRTMLSGEKWDVMWDGNEHSPSVKAPVPGEDDVQNDHQYTRDLSQYFEDLDGDSLTYSANVGTVNGNGIWKYTFNTGHEDPKPVVTVTITAYDNRGTGQVKQSFILSDTVAPILTGTSIIIQDGSNSYPFDSIDGALNVKGSDPDITITYSEPVFTADLTGLLLKDGSGNPVAYNASCTDSKLYITPVAPLLEDRNRYTLIVPAGAVRDNASPVNPSANGYEGTFTTQDIPPPQVISPPANNSGIGPRDEMVFTFSEDFVRLWPYSDACVAQTVLVPGTPPTYQDVRVSDVNFRIDEAARTITFTLGQDRGLLDNAPYKLVMASGFLQDWNGNRTSQIEFNFTTGDVNSPVLVPDGGWRSEGGNTLIIVGSSTPTIELTYKENLAEGVNFGLIRVEHETKQNLASTLYQVFGQFNGTYTSQAAGVAAMAMQELDVNLTVSTEVTIQNNKLRIAVNGEPLIPNYLYRITIPAGALQDVHGTATSVPNLLELSNTDAGTAPKIVWSGSLTNGKLLPGDNPALPNLNPGAHIGIAFNQPVTQGFLGIWTSGAPCPITLERLDSENTVLESVNYIVHFESIRLDSACYALRLELAHPLMENTLYRLTIPAGTVQSTLTGLLNAEYVKDFTTGTLELPGIETLESFGLYRAGEMVYANFEFQKYNNMYEGASLFQWYVSDDAAGEVNLTPVTGNTTPCFEIPDQYVGKYLWLEVTPQVENDEYLFPAKIGPFGPIQAAFGTGISLSSLQVTSMPLAGGTPAVLLSAVQPAKQAYSLGVGLETQEVTIQASAVDNNAGISINGVPGSERLVSLKLGVNPVVIAVTAENGLLQNLYTVTFNRSAGGEAAVLPDCFVQVAFEGQIYPGMVLEETSYYYDTELRDEGNSIFKWYRGDGDGKNLVQVGEGPVYQVTQADVGYYLYVQMTPLTIGGVSGSPLLSPGVGPVIDPSILLASVYDLDSLSIDAGSGELINNFSQGVTTYQRSVGLASNAADITVAASPADAVVTINGTPVSAPLNVSLSTGVNLFTINVEKPVTGGAETAKTYIVTIDRRDAANIPQAANVHIGGTAVPGETATGEYQYNCAVAENNSLYLWYTADGASGEDRSIVGTASNSYTIRAEDAGRYIFFEVQPVNEEGAAGDPVDTTAFGPVSFIPHIVSTAPTGLVESTANDGSLADGVVTIVISGGRLADPLGKADVTPANLPPGLDYSIDRDSTTQLTVYINGQATNHNNADDVSGLTFTIDQAKVSGAAADLVSGSLTINFYDPTPAAPTDGSADDIHDTFGWTDTPGYVGFANYEYSLNSGAAWSTCTANPQPVGNRDFSAGDVRVRLRADDATGKPAGAELVSDQAFTRSDIKPGAGVTLIVHGFQPVPSEPSWTAAMQDAILTAASGSAYQKVTMTVTGEKDDLHVSVTTWNVTQAEMTGAQIVVRVDWSAVANHLSTNVTAQEVAAAIAPYIYQGQNGQPPLAELPIHLIGHSRGGGLVYDLARLLGEQGIGVDQLTSLDPHPLTSSDAQGIPETIDTPINGVPENVLFADNYYQTIDYPEGQEINGVYNRQLTALPGGYHAHPLSLYQDMADHLNVYLWYLGSIDLSDSVFDGQATLGTAERSNWYCAYENQGARAGFYYSRIGGGDRLSPAAPVFTGNVIKAGYHSDPLLGGLGSRDSLDWTGAVWPDVITLDIQRSGESLGAGIQTVAPGENLDMLFTFRDNDSLATVTFCADQDANPYNGNDLAALATIPESCTSPVISQDTAVWTVAHLSSDDYYVYARINDGVRTRYLYSSTIIRENAAAIYAVSPAALSEADVDDGSLASGDFIITIINGTLAADIDAADVAAAHLPSGLSFNVTRDSATQLTVALSGAAAVHDNAADVDNLTFTLAQDKVSGATSDLTTPELTLDFNDPAPAAPTGGQVDDDHDNFGWTITSGYPDFSDYEFSVDSGTKWSGCLANPQSVGNQDFAAGAVRVRVKADPSSGRPAGDALSSGAPFTVADEVPAAPSNGQVDDTNDTFSWTNASGYPSVSNYQFSTDNGTGWADCTANPQYIGDHNIPAGAVQVRVKSHLSTGSGDTEKTHPAGNSLASGGPYNRRAAITSTSPLVLSEAAANDGSLASSAITVIIDNGTLSAGIAKADVSAANLPSNLDFSINRDSDTQLTLTITGQAANHANADDVDNLSFTIKQSAVTRAAGDLTTENIYLDFSDYALATDITGLGSIAKYPNYALYDSGISVQLTAVPSTGWNFSGWTGVDSHSGNNASINMDSNSTISAVFAASTHTVTFNSRGGSAVASQTIDYGNKATEPSAPTRTDYTFGGWYKETGCTNVWNFASDTVTSDVTLYARWTQALSKPDKPVLMGKTATWSSVANENNGYSLQLYKDSLAAGTAAIITHGSPLSNDFSTDMAAAGSYTVTVTARGTGSFTDSPASDSSDQEIVVSSGGTDGQAQLPAAAISLGNDGSIDLQDGLQNAVGGQIVLEGQTYDLDSYTRGDLHNVDLTQPQNIGGQTLAVQQAVRLESGTQGQPVTITNSDNPDLSITIPDGTAAMASGDWDGTLIPPHEVAAAGTAPSGFSIGDTVIEVGSASGIILFDKPVILELKGVTGPVGYKPAGSDTWVQITSVAGGTYTEPLPPEFSGEAYITNGTDTKIITWHFTGFAGLNDQNPPPPAASIASTVPTTLTESYANDGSLASGTIVVTIADGTLSASISKADVTASHLPAGLDYTITRTDAIHLTINITGKAVNHAEVNDVDNLTFTIAQARVSGAQSDLTTTNISINFYYLAPLFTLEVNVSGQGYVARDPDQVKYLSGTSVTLTPVPLTGWRFSGWSGDLGGSDCPASIVMNGDKTVTASFTRKTYNLTVNAVPAEGGTVNLNNNGPYYYDDVVRLTAVPAAGYSFNSWSNDAAGTSNPTTITINEDKTVNAIFTLNSGDFTITAAAGTGGSITPSGEIKVKSGSNQTFTISPDSSYYVETLIIDGSAVPLATSYTFNAITANHTISVTFFRRSFVGGEVVKTDLLSRMILWLVILVTVLFSAGIGLSTIRRRKTKVK